MLESIGRALSAVKEGAVEAGAKAYVNRKIETFGKVTRLEINPRARTIHIEVELKGEASLVAVNVGGYDIIDRDGAKYMTLRDVSASREWIGLAVEQYVVGQQFKIPEGLSRIL